jgi:aspartate 1-decarboxylase
MLRTLMQSKIHPATVTDADLLLGAVADRAR